MQNIKYVHTCKEAGVRASYDMALYEGHKLLPSTSGAHIP